MSMQSWFQSLLSALFAASPSYSKTQIAQAIERKVREQDEANKAYAERFFADRGIKLEQVQDGQETVFRFKDTEGYLPTPRWTKEHLVRVAAYQEFGCASLLHPCFLGRGDEAGFDCYGHIKSLAPVKGNWGRATESFGLESRQTMMLLTAGRNTRFPDLADDVQRLLVDIAREGRFRGGDFHRYLADDPTLTADTTLYLVDVGNFRDCKWVACVAS